MLGGIVDARRQQLSDDTVHWEHQLDRGYTVAQLAVAAGSSSSRLYRHLLVLGVWPRPRRPESTRPGEFRYQLVRLRSACQSTGRPRLGQTPSGT